MTEGAEKTEHHGTGHRARLRTRLLEKNGDSLHDHELVESPRACDTAPRYKTDSEGSDRAIWQSIGIAHRRRRQHLAGKVDG